MYEMSIILDLSSTCSSCGNLFTRHYNANKRYSFLWWTSLAIFVVQKII
jgi:hypothetical protein